MCPKCQGRLYTVERQGLRIEQCERCRGIFLDHGELEQLLSAEQRFYGSPGGHRDSPRPYRGRADSPRPYSGHPGHSGHYADSPRPYRQGHKKSFLGDLFG
ncbi:MAG: TFIIB-type zinc ribbon-containing protein [Pseudonocardia sp.]